MGSKLHRRDHGLIGSRQCNAVADDGADHNGALALRIWDAARSITATLAERQLANVCRVDVNRITDVGDVLRFEPCCPLGSSELPCLVALVRDVITDEPKAIICIALDGAGQKIAQHVLGPKEGGAIKLWEDAAVEQGLVVGVRLEAVTAAATRVEQRGACIQPAWALLDHDGLRDFPVMTAIEALTILIDNDQSDEAQDAADACTRRWLGAVRFVHQIVLRHSVDADFNNIAAAGGAR